MTPGFGETPPCQILRKWTLCSTTHRPSLRLSDAGQQGDTSLAAVGAPSLDSVGAMAGAAGSSGSGGAN